MMDTQYTPQYMQGQPVYTGYTPAPSIKQPSGWGKLWAAFGLAFAVLFVQGIAMIAAFASASDDTMISVGEIVGGVCAILFIVALGGKKLATPSMRGMAEAWRIIKWIFIADAVIAVIDIASYVVDGSFELAQLWPLRVLILLIMCAGIGLFEEATFRGLIFHGLLARMGTNKKGIFWAVIVSSLIFGCMHIDPTSMNWTDPSQLLQALLKIVQTGIFGFAAAVVVLKTGNIWPVALLHGLNDFMLMLVTNGLMSDPITTEYVTEGTDGLIAIGIYLVLCAAYVPSIVVALRILKEHDAPDRGQFYRAKSYPIYSLPVSSVPPQTVGAPLGYSGSVVPSSVPSPNFVYPQNMVLAYTDTQAPLYSQANPVYTAPSSPYPAVGYPPTPVPTASPSTPAPMQGPLPGQIPPI